MQAGQRDMSAEEQRQCRAGQRDMSAERQCRAGQRDKSAERQCRAGQRDMSAEQQRQCRAGSLPAVRVVFGRVVFRGGFLEDGVHVGAADPERRDPGPARATGLRPGPGLGQQPHRAGRPVHVRRRLVGVQRGRQHAVPQRQHHLDHPGHARGRLGVADVGLDRAQPQRPVLPAGPARRWPAAPAPRSGRPAGSRSRAPPPRPPRPRSPARWPARRGSPAAGRGRSGAVSPLDAPSWFTALPRTTASTGWP